MRTFIVILSTIVVISCATVPQNTKETNKKVDTSAIQEKLPENRKVYFLQHRLMRDWTFNSNSQFYYALKSGDISKLKEAAEDIVSLEFASGITVQNVNNIDGVLLSFPAPIYIADCYFVFISKVNNRFKFITYEKTLKLGELNPVGVVGAWSREGSHFNFGYRDYSDEESFIADAIRISGN